MGFLTKNPDIQKAVQPKAAQAETNTGREADVEFKVDDKIIGVKLRCFNTNCRVQIQNIRDLKRMDYMNNKCKP